MIPISLKDKKNLLVTGYATHQVVGLFRTMKE